MTLIQANDLVRLFDVTTQADVRSCEYTSTMRLLFAFHCLSCLLHFVLYRGGGREAKWSSAQVAPCTPGILSTTAPSQSSRVHSRNGVLLIHNDKGNGFDVGEFVASSYLAGFVQFFGLPLRNYASP